MNVIEGTGSIVVEPNWVSLFSDVLEIAAAKKHWRIVTTEPKATGSWVVMVIGP
jgi:hypothetical protein